MYMVQYTKSFFLSGHLDWEVGPFEVGVFPTLREAKKAARRKFKEVLGVSPRFLGRWDESVGDALLVLTRRDSHKLRTGPNVDIAIVRVS